MIVNKQKLLEAKAQFGHLKKYRHPQIKPFLYENKEKKDALWNIFDLEKLINCCQMVFHEVKKITAEKKIILFVGTKKHAKEIIKEKAIDCHSPYMANKWPGGLLTNFEETTKQIKNLKFLESLVQSDHFQKLPKKEKKSLEGKRKKLKTFYEGISNLKCLPHCMFVVDPFKEKTAVEEAKTLGISVIALCSSNYNPQMVDYFLLGNNHNAQSISFFVNLITEAIKETCFSSSKISKLKQNEKTSEKKYKEKIINNSKENGRTL